MEIQYYDLKIHMNIVHGDAYVPTEDDDDAEEVEEETEDEFNSGDESEVENRGGGRKRRKRLKENSKGPLTYDIRNVSYSLDPPFVIVRLTQPISTLAFELDRVGSSSEQNEFK